MTDALALSSPERLSEWLAEPVDGRLIACLDATRESITTRVSASRVAAFAAAHGGALPEALHLAATMEAAAVFRRVDSVYGVDAFAVGGDDGPGFLTFDPTVERLVRAWAAAPVGAAQTDASI